MASGARFERDDLAPALVITAGVVVAAVPFVVSLPAVAIAALWLVSFVARSVAPVHQHCHAHRAIFGRGWLDTGYDAILMLAGGNTTAVWELQHVRGHHRHYLERERDPANNDRFGGGRLKFTVVGDAMSFVDSLRVARDGGFADQRARLWRQSLAQLALVAALVAWQPALGVAFVVVPWLLLRWAVFWFSFAQHDTVPMTDVYSGSVTSFAWTNRFYLNVGHHTAHHEKPTLHWTRLPAHTNKILDRIPATCLR